MFVLEVAFDLYLCRYFKLGFTWIGIVGYGVIVYVIISFLHQKKTFIGTPGR